MKPDWAEAHYHLGQVFQEQTQWEEAIASYQQAQRLQPDYPEVDLGIANVYSAQGLLDPEMQRRYAAMNLEFG